MVKVLIDLLQEATSLEIKVTLGRDTIETIRDLPVSNKVVDGCILKEKY